MLFIYLPWNNLFNTLIQCKKKKETNKKTWIKYRFLRSHFTLLRCQLFCCWQVVFLGCTASIVRRTVADIVGSLTVTEKRAPVSTDVKMDISGVSVTKVRPTKGKHTFLRPFIVYKFTNVQIHTHIHCLTICLSVCRSVGRSVRPSVHLSIHPSIHLLWQINIRSVNDFSACPVGKYGPNCGEICGHCYNNTVCYHGNGTCLEGCEAGYWNHNCKTRALFSFNFLTINLYNTCVLFILNQLNFCVIFFLQKRCRNLYIN